MEVQDLGLTLLQSGKLEDKLSFCSSSLSFEKSEINSFHGLPHREKKIQFKKNKTKFPKIENFHKKEIRAMALHFFANHELLAIEMLAWALYVFPNHTDELRTWKRGLLKTLQDEQKHLSLYMKRMNELGVELGDYSLNQFFWDRVTHIHHPEQFAATLGMTFESANLDFAFFYSEVFDRVEDPASKKIMDIVLEDEITHVAHARFWLNKWKGANEDFWNYYLRHLPENLSPQHAIGKNFQAHLREKAGIDSYTIDQLTNFSS